MPFRLFKTKRFALQAGKAWITDEELQGAFLQMLQGQADDLGGGVWKKRLNANRHRSIVLAKGGHYWIYQVLFAKQDQSNITPIELRDLRKLAKAYARLTEEQIGDLLAMKEFVEIFHEQEIQK
ncbi:type II toxin-antitoxin system RelE/ParE family toxin [Pseudomonas sp. SWRI99]|uniref:type II toxin-antitoxin system RelE/ParE family toxin n=1 Tax=Pseudomonas sp. SWRI99 TaxID=2745506 RepID=UPI001647D969|nr:type II toxin-antitoxin system RelE/ParE family toxin [Pseudomonas sp. SWRI99]MBC3777290.1 type II toxin-antitoxin system RelE/ParE family toxin [Pseudomonas sp. SWRI99]